MKKDCKKENCKKRIGSKIYATVLAVVASIALFACQQTNTIDEQMNLATQYMSEGNYEQAIVIYREVLAEDPENVDAYLGIADAYEAMEDYEIGLTVLEEAYEVTGEETLVQKMEAVEELQVAQQEALQAEEESEEEKEAWELGPNPIGGNASFDMEPAVPACEINGVKHPAYYEFEFTDEQKAYLDNLIELTESGQYGQAIAALDEEMIKEMSNMEGNQDGSDYGCYWINCVYKDRKIHLARLPYAMKFVVIPLEGSVGYAIATGEDIPYAHLVGSCSGGLFNGEFTASAIEIYPEGKDNITYTGNLVNGTLDGDISEYVAEHKTTYVRSYNNGKLIYWDMKPDGDRIMWTEGYYIDFEGKKHDLTVWGYDDTVEAAAKYIDNSLYTFDFPISRGLHSISGGVCDW